MSDATPSLRIGDQTRIRRLDQPRPNATGTYVAYTELWLDEDADGPGCTVVVCDPRGRELARLDRPGRRDVGLCWSPSGRRLAVAAGAVLVLTTGLHPQFVQVSPDVGAVRVDWSPDERWWAVEVDGGDVPGLQVMDASGSSGSRSVLPGGSHPAWVTGGSVAGRRVVDGVAQLVAVGVTDGRLRVLSEPGQHVIAHTPTHDGLRVAYLERVADRLDAAPRLRWLDLTTGMARTFRSPAVGTLGLAVQADDLRGTEPQLVWSETSGRVYAYETVGGVGPLRWFDDEGATGQVSPGEGVLLSPGCSRTGLLLSVRTDPAHPGDIWATDERTGRKERLTHTHSWLTEVATDAQPVELAGAQGALGGWLWGAGARAAGPLVVSIHGGPYYAVGRRFTFEAQRLAALGYAVLTLNPRGSVGRDEPFTQAIAGRWGGPDAEDVLRAVSGLCARRSFEGVVVTGVSYGGFLAQLLLTRSSMFRGAVSENGISDFALLYAGEPRQRAVAQWAMGGPVGSTDHYVTRSPRHQVSGTTGPLLLLHAEDDRTCPVAQSRAMAATMTAAGRPVELVTLPGEGHLVNLDGRPSSRRRRARALDDWLHRIAPVPPHDSARHDRQGARDGRHS